MAHIVGEPLDNQPIARPGDQLRVEWEDIQDFSDEDWNGDPDVIDTATVATIGFCMTTLRADTRVLKLCRDRSVTESTYHGARAIPMGAVISIYNMTADEEWESLGSNFRVVGD